MPTIQEWCPLALHTRLVIAFHIPSFTNLHVRDSAGEQRFCLSVIRRIYGGVGLPKKFVFRQSFGKRCSLCVIFWLWEVSRPAAAVVSSQKRISYFTVLRQLAAASLSSERCRLHHPAMCCYVFVSFVCLTNWDKRSHLDLQAGVLLLPHPSFPRPQSLPHLTAAFAMPELFCTPSPPRGTRPVWSWPDISAIFFQDGARRSHWRPRGEEALSGTGPL